MPSHTDPVADALAATEAVRSLAHTTHDITDPESTYRILGAMSATLWSLRQSLEQLAAWHEGNARRALTVDEPPPAGQAVAKQIADDLRFAALSVARASAHVDQGWRRNGRITWTAAREAAGPAADVANRAQQPATVISLDR